MADEQSLNFFHGAILDEDADVFLVQDGDYLIQAKPDRRFGSPKLILAVKKGQTKVRRIDIVKIEGAGYRFMGKSYADLQQLINQFSTRPLELANGDTILLKRPIPKGKFSFNHKDIRLQRKIISDVYGTVYKGVMVKDDHPIIVKRIDSYGKNDQAFIDMMKEAREMQLFDPNFYGLIFDRVPYLLVMHNISATQSTDASDSQEHSLSTSSWGSSSSNSDMESSTSNDSIASTETAVPRLLENYDFNCRQNWDRSLPPPNRCHFARKFVCPSLSSIGSSSSDSEDDEEIDVGLLPRYYNDTNDLSDDEEKISVWLAGDLDMNCRCVRHMFCPYWETVQKLSEDRQRIIRILKKRLEPEQYLVINDDEKVIRVNIEIEQCESLLNSFIPIVPRWKATYQNGSDKKIIIRKGFIYERIGETNEFQCVYKNGVPYERCVSLLHVDNCDTLIGGSFCYHNHPAADNEAYTNDVPPPAEAPVSFRRVTKEGQKWVIYSKLMKFLEETVNELNRWKSHAMLCEERLNLLKQYVKQLEAADHPNNKIGIRCKMVVEEARNLLNCVRLDK